MRDLEKFSLQLFDSQTQQLLEPPTQQKVSFYACGITPYSSAHLGHARSFVVFDLMVKLLRMSGKNVTFVRNITDIDDKIIEQAKKTGQHWFEVSDHFAAENNKFFAQMGISEDVLTPKASDYLQEMFDMIEGLLEKNIAYISEETKDVLFDTSFNQGSFLTFDKNNLRGGRVSSLGKRHEEDFVLWKHTPEGEVSFDSPFGRGRPGWHIECSSMISRLLGETIDYHGGGVDLKFPHHHAECLQSMALHNEPLSRHWLHHGVVRDELGRKMSKSLGNVILLEDALLFADKLLPGFGGELLRLTMLSTLWTKPMDFSFAMVEAMHLNLTQWAKTLEGGSFDKIEMGAKEQVFNVLSQNMNTPLLFSSFHQWSKNNTDTNLQSLSFGLTILGVPSLMLQALLKKPVITDYDEEVVALMALREEKRQQGDFKEADRLRDELKTRGIDLSDKPMGLRNKN